MKPTKSKFGHFCAFSHKSVKSMTRPKMDSLDRREKRLKGKTPFSPPLSGRIFRSIIFVREAAMSIANRVGLTRVDEFSSPFGHY